MPQRFGWRLTARAKLALDSPTALFRIQPVAAVDRHSREPAGDSDSGTRYGDAKGTQTCCGMHGAGDVVFESHLHHDDHTVDVLGDRLRSIVIAIGDHNSLPPAASSRAVRHPNHYRHP
jgi:hypothetical protein